MVYLHEIHLHLHFLPIYLITNVYLHSGLSSNPSSPSALSQTSIYNTVVYLHEIHAVNEWRERMPKDKMDAVAACHDENVAKAAKAAGFKVNILFFY